MSHKWTFVLTDLQGVQLGEVTNANARKVSLPLNRTPSANFVIPANHYLAPFFADQNWDGMLKCYRDGVLRFVGPVVTSDDQPDANNAQSISVTAAGAMWRLGYRMLGTTQPGWSLGNASTLYDLGFIAQQMMAAGNATGYTGISNGTLVSSSNGAVGPFWFKPIDQAIAELSTGAASFDFEVAPVEPTNVGLGWPHIGDFNCTSLMGTVKSNAVFEYGTSHANIKSYGHTIDRTNMANKAWIQQPAAADHSGILSSQDATSIATRGYFETLVDDGGTEWDVLRQKLADEHVNVRKQARRILTITPVLNSTPNPLVDFIVGDQIPVHIAVDRAVRLNALLRVWGLTFNIGNDGNESVDIAVLSP